MDEAERQKFVALSQVWWDEGGEFDLLHAMNDLRVPMVRDAVTANHERLGHTPLTKSKPLANTRILDVGCGGGILSEVNYSLNVDIPIFILLTDFTVCHYEKIDCKP